MELPNEEVFISQLHRRAKILNNDFQACFADAHQPQVPHEDTCMKQQGGEWTDWFD